MLQDIHPHQLEMGYMVREPRDDDYAVTLKGNKIYLSSETGDRIPRVGVLREAGGVGAEDLLYLFSMDGRGVFLVTGECGEVEEHGFEDMGVFREYEPGWQAFMGVTACHLGQWYLSNRFCGVCGEAMARKADERAMECGGCGAVVYPRISPAVIVGVVDGDRIVMTRYANRPGSRFGALIAGFMEVGETLEDTVRREVFEEVGLRVGKVRYYKSQPWAFSGSVLMGFYAELSGSATITMDEGELDEARWVSRDEIDENEGAMSLTAEMIEMFRRDEMP